MRDNPWLNIPAADYEAHMRTVGQSAALRALFAEIYAERRPRRLAVLGCTTGSDLESTDPALTDRIVGVDVNRAFVEIARRRLTALGPRLHLVAGDVLEATLPDAPFDLVHAALLLEYVDPHALFRRIHRWLAPDGACSVITQDPLPGVAAVSDTGYESLQILSGRMILRNADEVAALAARAGFRLLHQRATTLATGKRLVSSLFVPADIELAPATTPDDHAAARDLFAEYAAGLGVDLGFQDLAHELEHLAEIYRPPAGCLLLGREAGIAVACVALRPRSPEICEMKRLFVREAARGRGIGRRLASEIVKVARTLGYRRMVLDTLGRMTGPRHLYASLGFEATAPYYDNPLPDVRYLALDLRADLAKP